MVSTRTFGIFSTTSDRVVVLWLVLLVLAGMWATASAATGEQLRAALYAMAEPKLDESAQFKVSNLTLNAHDFEMTFEDGDLGFFEPVSVGDSSIVYGAYFDGRGVQRFTPSVAMERDQLQRFFEQDSLVAEFRQVLLLFNAPVLEHIKSGSLESSSSSHRLSQRGLNRLADYIHTDKNYWDYYRVLLNNVQPESQPYLLAIISRRAMQMLIAVAPLQRLHRLHPKRIGEGTEDMDGLLEGELDLKAQAIQTNDLDGVQREVR